MLLSTWLHIIALKEYFRLNKALRKLFLHTLLYKGKGSPYSIAERRVLGSQPAGRLPLLSARPAVTRATLQRL